MQILCCQLNSAWEHKAANFKRAGELVTQAAPRPNTLVVFSEMFATGFSMDVAAACDGPERPTEQFLAKLAREFSVFTLGGVVRRADDGRGLNEAVAFGPDGSERARYCKLHPFSFASEQTVYAPGNALASLVCNEFTVAPLICYDLRFPETFRVATQRGATLLCVIANWPRARHAHWTALLKARAIENQAFVAGVNRCGSDPNHSYAGGSQIVDPRGEIMAAAGEGEEVIAAALDLNALSAWRREFPALNDIRGDGL